MGLREILLDAGQSGECHAREARRRVRSQRTVEIIGREHILHERSKQLQEGFGRS